MTEEYRRILHERIDTIELPLELARRIVAHAGKAWDTTNDGIGVPLNPVVIVLKISWRDEPPRNVQGCARFAARIG